LIKVAYFFTGMWYNFRVALTPNGGKPRVLVSVASLNTEAKLRYIKQEKAKYDAMLPKVQQPEKPKQPINLAELEACVGHERFMEIIRKANRCKEMIDKYRELCKKFERKEEAVSVVAGYYNVSVPTLYRYIQKFEKFGYEGLLRLPPKFIEQRGVIRTSINEEVRRIIRGEYLQLNQPKVTHVYNRVQVFCKFNEFEVPSQATVYRYIRDMERNEPDLICMAREGEEEYSKRYMHKVHRELPALANAVWQGDHHKLDAFIEYNGKPYRPWVTLWYDVATCTARGFTLALHANGKTITQAFRHGVLKKQLPQFDVTGVRDIVLKTVARLGWLPDELQSLSGWETPLYGLPEQLYIDNGEDYRSKCKKGLKHEGWEYSDQIRSLNSNLNIDALFCTKYTPWAKGNCERFFLTLTDQFSRYLPGYCGSNNKKRPAGLKEDKLAAKGELLTLDELYMILEFRMHFYHSTVHSTLG